MGKIIDKLIPKLREEFILVIFLMIAYSLSQLNISVRQMLIIFSTLLALLIVWLIKVFIREEYSRHYKGAIVLLSGLALFMAGFYSAGNYYLEISKHPVQSLSQYFYLFFPLWVMVEGALMLFILNFDNQIKSIDLEAKIEITEPSLGDYIVVAIAAVVLILLGEIVLDFPWYLNICLVLTINLIVINQFGGQYEIQEKKA